MLVFFRNKSYIIFALLFLASIAPFLGKLYQKKVHSSAKTELFDPSLEHVNSLDKVLKYTDNIYYQKKSSTFDTLTYVQILSDFIKNKFYHGLSNYSFSDNWIAYLSGKIIWSHFSAIVNPEHILKYPEGLCSQQNIIFAEVLRKKGITSRPVGLGPKEGPGHFLTEVHYNNGWHIYDVDLEPNWEITKLNHPSIQDLVKNKDVLYKIYENKLQKSYIDLITQRVIYGEPNTFPAKKMFLFHQITLALTFILPTFFLMLFIRSIKKLQKARSNLALINEQKESVT